MAIRKISAKKVQPGFKLVDDPREANRLLEQAALTRADVDVRLGSEMEGSRHKAQVLEPSSVQDGLRLALKEPVPEEAIRALRASVPGLDPEPDSSEEDLPVEALAIVFLRGESLLGVRATRVQLLGQEVRLAPPSRYFVMQRRKEARYQIPRGYEFFVSLEAVEGPSRRVEKRLIDLSGGGLAFHVLSPREAQFFKIGKLLRRVEIQLRSAAVVVDVEVCNHSQTPAELRLGGVKIGCRIVAITPQDQEKLLSFVAARLAGM